MIKFMRKYPLVIPSLTAIFYLIFILFLFQYDNKYQSLPPYGSDGVIFLQENDFLRNSPIFLIDGWLFSDDIISKKETYIGEYSNLQHGALSTSPHGTALYELDLFYQGNPIEVSLQFPILFQNYSISLDSKTLARGEGSATLTFLLTEGTHSLCINTSSSTGFYSGMYHPPMLGQSNMIYRYTMISCLSYGAAFIFSLLLAIFSISIGYGSKDSINRIFGGFCISFSLYLTYYFIRLFSLPGLSFWYVIQSIAFYSMCYYTVMLIANTSKFKRLRPLSWIRYSLLLFPTILLSLSLFIPLISQLVYLHGILTNIYLLMVFFILIYLVFDALISGSLLSTNYSLLQSLEELLLLSSSMIFGVGLYFNLIHSNLFEPILLFWQFEWCGIFLVLLFSFMMLFRTKRILLENRNLSNNLEKMVAQRTSELQNLLQERKLFFSNMAHDLKAPIYATQTFIRSIREHNTGIDHELIQYINAIEQKQNTMERRVQGFSLLNKMDNIEEPKELVSIIKLLNATYESNHMAAEVQSVFFTIALPEQDGTLYAQPGKLSILLENLFFNALHATPAGGRISLSAELDDEFCHLILADTGCGIPLEELPHIFERFYVGKKNIGIGSGLGLTIVNNIVQKMNGEINVASRPGEGTTFHVDLPLYQDFEC